eukprot:1248329-Amphidinium_carterae.1
MGSNGHFVLKILPDACLFAARNNPAPATALAAAMAVPHADMNAEFIPPTKMKFIYIPFVPMSLRYSHSLLFVWERVPCSTCVDVLQVDHCIYDSCDFLLFDLQRNQYEVECCCIVLSSCPLQVCVLHDVGFLTQ